MRLFNPFVILRILSTIILIETVSFLLCLPVALIYGESTRPFILSALSTGFIVTIFFILSRKEKTSGVSPKEGYLSVTLAWFILCLLGGLPYLYSGSVKTVTDAFFESASGFTTTGSSIFKDVEILPYSILFWRSLTHWIGGLGIIVLVIIILPSLRVVNYQLFSLESSLKEKIHPRTKAVGFRLLYIYLGLTITEILLLNAGEMNLFESICHTFGTVATGGFSTKNGSIAHFSHYSQYIIMLFMFLSGVSFVVFYYLFKLRLRKVRQNDELWFYLAVVIIAVAVVTSLLIAKTNRPFEVAFREGAFQVISILTTTGYANADYLFWPLPALVIIFLLFFAGASTGSTTGSIKMGRHLIVLKNIRNVFIKVLHPNAIYQIRINNQVLNWNTNIAVISFVVLYLFIFVVFSAVISLFGTDALTSASIVAASFGNVGPALGQIGAYQNYSLIPVASKWILSFLMILGRLEVYTLIVLFTRSFWKN